MRRAALVGLVLLPVLLTPLVGCKKKRTVLRDTAGLPTITRPYPIVTSEPAIDASNRGAIQDCYDHALALDPAIACVMTLRVTAASDGPQIRATKVTGTSNAALQACITMELQARSSVPLEAGTSRDLVLTLHSENRTEPLAPGLAGAATAYRRYLASMDAHATLSDLQASGPFVDSIGDDGRRLRAIPVSIVVQLTEDGMYETCGDLGDLTGHMRGPPCPKKRRMKGDHLTYTTTAEFSLEKEGWNAMDSNFYGDIVRESD